MNDIFAQALLQSDDGTTVALDLRHENGLLAGGVLLSPSGGQDLVHEIELRVDSEVVHDVESSIGIAELPLPLEEYRVAYRDMPELLVWAYQPDPTSRVFRGKISREGETVGFLIREFGSPEPITICVTILLGIACAAGLIKLLVHPCEKRARDVCSGSGVKSVKGKLGWRMLGCQLNCEIECFDRPRAEYEAAR